MAFLAIINSCLCYFSLKRCELNHFKRHRSWSSWPGWASTFVPTSILLPDDGITPDSINLAFTLWCFFFFWISVIWEFCIRAAWTLSHIGAGLQQFIPYWSPGNNFAVFPRSQFLWKENSRSVQKYYNQELTKAAVNINHLVSHLWWSQLTYKM